MFKLSLTVIIILLDFSRNFVWKSYENQFNRKREIKTKNILITLSIHSKSNYSALKHVYVLKHIKYNLKIMLNLKETFFHKFS